MNLDLLTTLLFHLTTLAIVIITVNFFVMEVLAFIERRKIEGRFRVKTNKQPFYQTMPLIGAVYRGMLKKLSQKGNGHLADIFTIIVLVVSFLPVIVFGYFGQYLLMIAVPLALIKTIKDILVELDVSDEQMIIEQLPQTIDNLNKTAGRHENIQVALSEATVGLAQPMKGELEGMVRKMNSQDRRTVLEDFQNKYQNPWVRSFIFILVSLVEDAERKTALDNLKVLREMIASEGKMAKQSVTDKRQSAIQNYVIAAIAFIASIIVMFTDFGRTFYFETGFGLFSLLGGYAAIFITIRMNVNMLSRKGDE